MKTEPGTYFKLPSGFAIEVVGADAMTVVNNLCTNDLPSLRQFDSMEAFVTNVKGWTVAHVIICKLADRILLLGQHPSPSLICEHIDRYIIREDAAVSDITAQRSLLVVHESDIPAELPEAGLRLPMQLGDYDLLAISREDESAVVDQLGGESAAGEAELGSEEQFEALRVRHFWPLQGREITEKTIPQVLDRDATAISFTKGCYLGQETIARLDARGQLQQKLCLLKVESGDVESGTTLLNGEKEAGIVSSVAGTLAGQYALATLRRGCFEPGTELTGMEAKLVVLDTSSS